MPETKPHYRPEEADRWGRGIGRDQEPLQIEVRTEWKYSEPDPDRRGCVCCPGSGTHRHAFSRAGHVVRSDVTTHFNDIPGHLWEAIRQFGDDADIIIEVRRKTDG